MQLKKNKVRKWIAGVLITISGYRNKNPKAFILVESLFIGLITGLIAVSLKNIVHFTGRELYRNSSRNTPSFYILHCRVLEYS